MTRRGLFAHLAGASAAPRPLFQILANPSPNFALELWCDAHGALGIYPQTDAAAETQARQAAAAHLWQFHHNAVLAQSPNVYCLMRYVYALSASDAAAYPSTSAAASRDGSSTPVVPLSDAHRIR